MGAGVIQNPKSEYRNSKQIRNSNSPMSETQPIGMIEKLHSVWVIRVFVIAYCFVLRISPAFAEAATRRQVLRISPPIRTKVEPGDL